MLYLSTRDKSDISTSHRTIQSNRAADGGCYIPFNLPAFGEAEIRHMKELSFGAAVSKILNLFFATTSTGLGIDFLAEQYSVKLSKLHHRILVAELWHNLDSDFDAVARNIYSQIGAEKNSAVTQWCAIAIRIAALFGIYGELKRAGELTGGETFDVTVNIGDFSAPMACWYARKMGLPIGTIICTCNENGAAWDFLMRGEINGGQTCVSTRFPLLDHSVPAGLESLVCQTLGHEEAVSFAETIKAGKTYRAGEKASTLTAGFFASVVSSGRIEQVIRSVYRSANYFLEPYATFSYAGLQDYRAKTGESRTTVLLSEKSPVLFADFVSASCGVTEADIRKAVNAF